MRHFRLVRMLVRLFSYGNFLPRQVRPSGLLDLCDAMRILRFVLVVYLHFLDRFGAGIVCRETLPADFCVVFPLDFVFVGHIRRFQHVIPCYRREPSTACKSSQRGGAAVIQDIQKDFRSRRLYLLSIPALVARVEVRIATLVHPWAVKPLTRLDQGTITLQARSTHQTWCYRVHTSPAKADNPAAQSRG